MNVPIKIAISGIAGRMGSRILALAQKDPELRVVYGLESPGYKGDITGVTTGSDMKALEKADVVIDFTIADATAQLVSQIAAMKKPYVIGTTGFNDVQSQQISEAAKQIPIVKSANMSLGVNVFFKLAHETARALSGYDVEVVETHHVHKKDAPSGTALYAGGLIEKTTKKKVTYQSIREGEVVGDHRIVFKGPNERLELFHHAGSRDNFAAGALVAAKWIFTQKPGLYTMQDVLDLKL